MATQRRTAAQDRGRDTQIRILDGAASEFVKHGYGTVSIRSIAEESGISIGAIYFHFRTKESIAKAISEEQHHRSLRLIEEIAQPLDGTLQRLVHVSRALADQIASDQIVRAGMALSFEKDEFAGDVSGFYGDWLQAVTEDLRASFESGALQSRLTPSQHAEYLVAHFAGIISLAMARHDIGRLGESLATMWLGSVDGLVPADSREQAVAMIRSAYADVLPSSDGAGSPA